jgi:hypothetical protein
MSDDGDGRHLLFPTSPFRVSTIDQLSVDPSGNILSLCALLRLAGSAMHCFAVALGRVRSDGVEVSVVAVRRTVQIQQAAAGKEAQGAAQSVSRGFHHSGKGRVCGGTPVQGQAIPFESGAAIAAAVV